MVAVELQVENNELKEKIEQLTLQLACQLSADAHRNTHSLHFTGHYCRWTSVSLYQNVSIRYFIGAMEMAVVMTTGAVRCAKLQSNRH